ncbi:histidine kinase [Sporosarcina aquimarina]|uniref:Histidine kinase n=1 Tax=Sporosarcina aquimarina TaxID=114975 RepID=A0ABU4G1N8_9BACL|nr:histidine kinase [Sporosarcina aquimarina]MDW0110878.1 histidine kinase [Sporosarcina aquimarina]
MRKYFGLISLVMITVFSILCFVAPNVLTPLPYTFNTWFLLFLLIGSFILAIFSVKGPLKVITLTFSSIGMLGLLVVIIFVVTIRMTGNFGS